MDFYENTRKMGAERWREMQGERLGPEEGTKEEVL